MSDYVPHEIQWEIMTQLPVKSLIRFRSVSKTWKSIIDNSDFISKHYKGHRTKPQHLLVMYEDTLVRFSGQVDHKHKYVSIVDDHNFPKHKVSLKAPLLVKKLGYPTVIGTSHGLVALYSGTPGDGSTWGDGSRRTDVVVIWNISIRKAVAVFVPNIIEDVIYNIGFGVCRETNDPKIVRITYVDNPPEVEVFTLSTGAWRKLDGNFPSHIIIKSLSQNYEVVDGVLYWVFDAKNTTIDSDFRDIVISFDMTSEEFREITIPHSLNFVGISKLGESLVVFGQDEHATDSYYDIFLMGDGVSKSFTKLFTCTSKIQGHVLLLRKNGQFIIEFQEQGDDNRGQLAVYEPYSNHVDNLGIDGSFDSFVVCEYMETLLLLDQKDLMVYK